VTFRKWEISVTRYTFAFAESEKSKFHHGEDFEDPLLKICRGPWPQQMAAKNWDGKIFIGWGPSWPLPAILRYLGNAVSAIILGLGQHLPKKVDRLNGSRP